MDRGSRRLSDRAGRPPNPVSEDTAIHQPAGPSSKVAAQPRLLPQIPCGQPGRASLPKPHWTGWAARGVPPQPGSTRSKGAAAEHQVHTVCEEAEFAPNNRRVDSAMAHRGVHDHGRFFCKTALFPSCASPMAVPIHLTRTSRAHMAGFGGAAARGLRYVVVTSVDRDDLRDGGLPDISPDCNPCPSGHALAGNPDRGGWCRFPRRLDRALRSCQPHHPGRDEPQLGDRGRGLPRLARSGLPTTRIASGLTEESASSCRSVPTKSGLMVGNCARRMKEILQVDARPARGEPGVFEMLTIGSNLAPSAHQSAVLRLRNSETFDGYEREARASRGLPTRPAPAGAKARPTRILQAQARRSRRTRTSIKPKHTPQV